MGVSCEQPQADLVRRSPQVPPAVSPPGAERSLPVLASVVASIQPDLEEVERLLRHATRSRYPEVQHLLNQASAYGGKRLRPVLAIVSARAAVPGPVAARRHRDLLRAAAAIELVHAASLVHDDILDGAATRRHSPTAVSQSGTRSAILLGDYLFTQAYDLAARCRSAMPARVLAQAARRLCEGEMRQQAAVGDWEMSWRSYFGIVYQKTGSLCEASCFLGAAIAGADEEVRRQLRRFGRLLGIAFQIRDDWLDYFGGTEVGKTLGTDLDSSKPTLPLMWYLRQLGEEQRRELQEKLATAAPESMHQVRSAVRESGADRYTDRVARRIVARARLAVEGLADRVDPHSARDLMRLAELCVCRAS